MAEGKWGNDLHPGTLAVAYLFGAVTDSATHTSEHHPSAILGVVRGET